MTSTGRLVRRARLQAGLSQGELARRAGTSQPAVSATERDARDPSVATLRRLVAAADRRLVIAVIPEALDIPPADNDHERSVRLLQTLSLADAIPHRRVGPGTFPRMVSR